MRSLVCALLLACPLLAQNRIVVAPSSADDRGSFYVEGVVYQYAAGENYTVVVAAHSAINHKFLAVKVRIYNAGLRSITVKPEDVLAEDAVAGRRLVAQGGSDLSNRMRRPYNMARYGVNALTGDSTDGPITSDMVTPQLVEMMRAMSAREGGGGGMPAGKNLLYTDTPGALDTMAGGDGVANECDRVCRLRNREADGVDMMVQLQRPNSPEYIEQCSFRANTIPPRGNVAGVLYYPLGKLSGSKVEGKKTRKVRVTVPVEGESFQFVLPVE